MKHLSSCLLLLASYVLPANAAIEIVWTGDPDPPGDISDPGTGAMSDFNGTIPGTSITYAITATGPSGSGGPDFTNGVSDTATKDGDYKWKPEGTNYVKGNPSGGGTSGDFDLTITFSQPIPVNAFTTLAVDHDQGSSNITVGGGTATTADFHIDNGLTNTATEFGYTDMGVFGAFTRSGAGRHDGMLVGSNSNTMTWLRHQGASNNQDANILNFGFIQGVAIPEPSSFQHLGAVGLAALILALVRGYRAYRSS